MLRGKVVFTGRFAWYRLTINYKVTILCDKISQIECKQSVKNSA